MIPLAELEKIVATLLGQKVLQSQAFRDELTITVAAGQVVEIIEALRNHEELAFQNLVDLTAVDQLHRATDYRFEVVYHLYSPKLAVNLRIKVPCGTPVEGVQAAVPTITGLWRGADWLERETFDMFGIDFVGHPNLKRILMTEAMQGFPLRKDFPLHGPPEWPLKSEFKQRLAKPKPEGK